MKQLTDDQFQQIRNAALAQLTIQETAILVDVDTSLITEGAGAKAYLQGQIKAKAIAQTELFRQAKDGNTQALKQYVELCNRNQAEVE